MAQLGMDEDEDLERLKRWWKDNGLALVLGLVVGIAAIAAWQGWQAWQEQQAIEAVKAYNEFQAALKGSAGPDKLASMVAQLQANYSDSPYAAHAGLALAEYFAVRGMLGRAIESLGWVVNNAAQAPLRHIARVRQARLLWGQGKAEAALANLQHAHPPAFTSLYAELMGDIHAAAGREAQARQAYRRALEHLPPAADPVPLQRKLDAVAGGADQQNLEVS